MDTIIKNWLHKIDENTAAFQKEFGQLSNEQLNWTPNPKTWSIAQNIEHLIVINDTYLLVIKEVRAGDYKLGWMSKVGFLVRFFGKMILGSVKADRKKKIKTFPLWEPSKTEIKDDILARFTAHQSDLKKLIADSKDLLEKGQVIASPASKKIVYKLEAAFEIIVTHETRHFEQAKEVLALMEK
jgi:hypothetical protein